MKRRGWRALLVTVILVVAGTGSAEAAGWVSLGTDRPYVSPGLLLGGQGHTRAQGGVGGSFGLSIGGEVTAGYAWSYYGSLGGFLQAEAIGRGDQRADHARIALGGQGSIGPLLLEVGPYYSQSNASFGHTMGVQISPVLALGILSVGGRFGLPIGSLADGPRYGVEMGVVFYLKFPVALRGPQFTSTM
jgi:hypothetical protein